MGDQVGGGGAARRAARRRPSLDLVVDPSGLAVAGGSVRRGNDRSRRSGSSRAGLGSAGLRSIQPQWRLDSGADDIQGGVPASSGRVSRRATL